MLLDFMDRYLKAVRAVRLAKKVGSVSRAPFAKSIKLESRVKLVKLVKAPEDIPKTAFEERSRTESFVNFENQLET
jgi:hypothetical protein